MRKLALIRQTQYCRGFFLARSPKTSGDFMSGRACFPAAEPTENAGGTRPHCPQTVSLAAGEGQACCPVMGQRV